MDDLSLLLLTLRYCRSQARALVPSAGPRSIAPSLSGVLAAPALWPRSETLRSPARRSQTPTCKNPKRQEDVFCQDDGGNCRLKEFVGWHQRRTLTVLIGNNHTGKGLSEGLNNPLGCYFIERNCLEVVLSASASRYSLKNDMIHTYPVILIPSVQSGSKFNAVQSSFKLEEFALNRNLKAYKYPQLLYATKPNPNS